MMKVSSFRYIWVMILSMLIAIFLQGIMLPSWLDLLRPEWVLLVLCFWMMNYPFRFNVGFAWCVGMVVDLFQGTLLGSHALAYSLIAFVILTLQHRMRLFPIWQQSLIILAVAILQQLILLWTHSMQNKFALNWEIIIPIFSSALLWPWLVSGLRYYRRYFKLA